MKIEQPYINIRNNPDFNQVLILYGLEARSFRDKKNAKILLNKLKTVLLKIKCDHWPYSVPIMLSIGISGPKKMYSIRDVDNMCKVIMDAGNKIIYKDDKQINLLIVQKQLWEKAIHGVEIGIRVIDAFKKDKYSPTMCFISDLGEHLHQNDAMRPLIFHFENDADNEYVRNQKEMSNYLFVIGLDQNLTAG